MPVTIKDIARASGFSVPTVSQVLNNKGGLYRPQTREKILRTARELGYRPNSYRWVLRTGRFNNVGFLFPVDPKRGGVSSGTWRGMGEALAEHDMHLTAGFLPEEAFTDEGYVPKILRERSVDGLLIHHTRGMPASLAELIRSHDIPAVWLDEQRDADCVYTDMRSGLRDAAQYLIQLGHKRIAYATNHVGDDFCTPGHYEAYAEVMDAAGLAPIDLRAAEPVAGCERGMRYHDRFTAPDPPTAVIGVAPDDALSVFMGGTLAGLKAGRDFSVLFVGDSPVVVGGYDFSFVRFDTEEMGRAAVKMLLNKIDNPKRRAAPQIAPMRVIEGQTTAPPRRA